MKLRSHLACSAGKLGKSFDDLARSGAALARGENLMDQQGDRLGLLMSEDTAYSLKRRYTAALALIAAMGYRTTADDIRRFRQDIFALGDYAPAKSLSRSSDFFATSSCRDLFFHVEEHPTTIPAIKEFLTGNDLAFVGFDSPMRAEYAERFPADRAMTDLDRWHRF